MLKQIVQQSAKLVIFLSLLQLNFSKPQKEHVLRITDAVIVCDLPQKTLSGMYHLLVDAPDPSNAADFLRISPWKAADIQEPLKQFVVDELVRQREKTGETRLFVSIDDCLGAKDKGTKHMEAVDFHFDHNKSGAKKNAFTNSTQHVEVRVELGGMAYVYSWALYLRQKKVRRLNRKRSKGKRLPFRTKYSLARAILADLKARLPKGFRVYVLFDSWYASQKLLKFCRRQGWHIICALKSNRTLDGVKLSVWNQRLKHQRYVPCNPTATDKRKKPYLVRALQGRLKNVPFPVCVLISKRHRGDKRPKYFLCTDLTLTPQIILKFYKKRWPIEVDNYYVKQLLGLSDFRVRSFEATQKWFALVFLAYTFLQYELIHAPPEARLKTVADVIRQHRHAHAYHLLQTACHEADQRQDIERVLQRYIHHSLPAPD